MLQEGNSYAMDEALDYIHRVMLNGPVLSLSKNLSTINANLRSDKKLNSFIFRRSFIHWLEFDQSDRVISYKDF